MNTKEEIEDYINEKFVAGFQNITEVEERTALLMLLDSYWHKDDTISAELVSNVSYSELADLVDSDGLVPGQKYLLTDFRTIYDRPDFYVDGTAKSEITSVTSDVVEPLLLTAISENQFDDRVNSLLYPKDQLRFDFTWSSTEVNATPAKGRITERIDDKGNRTDYDHRHIYFLRYDVSGTGDYFSYVPTGYDEEGELFLTFPADSIATIMGDYAKFHELYFEPFVLANNVINGSYAYNSRFEVDYHKNCTFQEMEGAYVTCPYFHTVVILQFYGTRISCYNFTRSNFAEISQCSIKCNMYLNHFELWVNLPRLVACEFLSSTYDLFLDCANCNFSHEVYAFRNNIVKSPMTNIDFSDATHVFASYHCEIFRRQGSNLRLSYFDSSDSLVITDITD